MTAIAQGTNKTTSIVKQAALGTLGSSGSQTLRRRTSVFNGSVDTFESDEIVSHHQSTGVSYGFDKVDGKLDGLLSAGTYKLLIAAMLEKDFAATTPLVVGTDCTTSATAPQFVDASAGYLTGGLKVGDVVRWTGFTTTATDNNSRNFWITALTAGNMSGVFLDGTAVCVKAPETGSVTCTVVGKKSLVPLTGHTNDYFTVEEAYTDLARYELFGDCRVASIDIDLPATGNAAFACAMIGLSSAASASQTLTSPTAETTTGIMSSLNGLLYVNGAAIYVTSVKLSLSNSAANTGAEIGRSVGADVSRGRIKVSGSFTALFRDVTASGFFTSKTPVSLGVVLTADGTATSNFISITLGKIKITGASIDDGEKGLFRTYPFTAELNAAGGAALAWDQTIITVQDSAA